MYSGVENPERYGVEMDVAPANYSTDPDFQIHEEYYYQSEAGELQTSDGGYLDLQYYGNGAPEGVYQVPPPVRAGRVAATGAGRRKPALVKQKKSLTSIVDRLAKKRDDSPEEDLDKEDQEMMHMREVGLAATNLSHPGRHQLATPTSGVLSRTSSMNEMSGEDEVLDLSVSSSRSSNSSTPKFPPLMIEDDSNEALDLSMGSSGSQKVPYKTVITPSPLKGIEGDRPNQVLDLTKPPAMHDRYKAVETAYHSLGDKRVGSIPVSHPNSHKARHAQQLHLQVSPQQERFSLSPSQRSHIQTGTQPIHSVQLKSPVQQVHSIIVPRQISPGQTQVGPQQPVSQQQSAQLHGGHSHLVAISKHSPSKAHHFHSSHSGNQSRLSGAHLDTSTVQASQDMENTFRTNKMLLLQFLSRHTIQQKISGTNVEVELLNCRYCKYASTEKSCMMAHLTTTHVSKKHSRSRRGGNRFTPYSHGDPRSGKSHGHQQLSPVSQSPGQLSPSSQQQIFVPQQQMLLPSPPIARQERDRSSDSSKSRYHSDGSRPLKYHHYKPPSRPQDRTLYQQQKADAALNQQDVTPHLRAVPNQATAMQSPGPTPYSTPSHKLSVPHISPQVPHQLSPQLPRGKREGSAQSVIVPQITSVFQLPSVSGAQLILPKPESHSKGAGELSNFHGQSEEYILHSSGVSQLSGETPSTSNGGNQHTLLNPREKQSNHVPHGFDVSYSSAKSSNSQKYNAFVKKQNAGEHKLNNLCKKIAQRVQTKKERKYEAIYHDNPIPKDDGKVPVKKDIIKKNRLKLMTQTGIFTCKECHKTFDRPLSLFGHLKQHSPLINKQKIEVYQCTHCPKAFNIFQDLVNHLKTHSIVGDENVMITPVEYMSAAKKNRQQKSANKKYGRSKILPFKCNYCGKTFKNVRQLCGHLKLHGGVSGTKFVNNEKKSEEYDTKMPSPKMTSLKEEIDDPDDANKHYGLRKKARRDYRLDHDPMQDAIGYLGGSNISPTSTSTFNTIKTLQMAVEDNSKLQIAEVKKILQNCQILQRILKPFLRSTQGRTLKSKQRLKPPFALTPTPGYWRNLMRKSRSKLMKKQAKKLRSVVSAVKMKTDVVAFACRKCGVKKRTQRGCLLHVHRKHVIDVFKNQRHHLEELKRPKPEEIVEPIELKEKPAKLEAKDKAYYAFMNSFKQEKIDCVTFFDKIPVNGGHQFQCKMCCKVIKEQCFLARHLRTHRELPNNPAISSASSQSVGVANNGEMKTEEMKQAFTAAAHGNAVKQSYACSQCPYLCFTKMAYTRHMMTHEQKKVSSKSDATVSMQNVNPYCCNHCSQGFSKPRDLVNHLVTCKEAKIDGEYEEMEEGELIIDEKSSSLKRPASVKIKSKKLKLEHESKVKKEIDQKVDSFDADEIDEDGDEDMFQMQTMVSLGSYYDNTYSLGKKGSKKKLKDGEKPVVDADLVCKLCDSWSAKSMEELEHHLIKEHGAPRFDCKICETSLPNYRVLVKHLRKHTKVNLECDQCSYQTVEKRFMIRHVQTVHEQRKPYTCELCEYSTAYKHHLKRHYKSHCVDLLTCSKCSFCTLQDSKLQDHIAEHEISLSNVMCDQCCLTFPNTKLLQTHLAEVHNRHVSSEVVNSMTTQTARPEEEDAIDLSENTEEATRTFKTRFEKYECTGCKFVTDNVTQLSKHLLSAHIIQKPTFKKDAKRESSKKSDAKRAFGSSSVTPAMKSETKEPELVLAVDVLEKVDRSVQCPQCGLIVSMDQMESHLSTHSSGEIYACEHCPFESQVLEELQQHLEKKHSKNKESLTCQQCQKVETDILSLRDHSKTHLKNDVISEQNLFKCSLCPYTSHIVEEARNHLDQHNYVMEFKCQLCMYSCSTSSGIASHRRLHRKGPPLGPSPRKMSPSTKSTHSQSNRSNSRNSSDVEDGNKSTSSSEGIKPSSSPGLHLAEGCIYDCRYCDQKFSLVEEWQRHERRHHLEW